MELPKETKEKLVWLFLLSPGFISVTIVGMIVDLGQLSEFQIIYYSLVLTVVNVAIALAVLLILEFFGQLRNFKFHFGGAAILISSLIISVASGLTLGLAAESDTFFVTLRSLPITKELNKRSSSRPSSFLLSQNTRGQLNVEGDGRQEKTTDAFALVTLKNGGTRYEGWPEFYGLGKETSEIYLSPACERSVVNGIEKVAKIPGPGIVLYEDNIASITFINKACSPCYLRWYPQKVTTENQKACEI